MLKKGNKVKIKKEFLKYFEGIENVMEIKNIYLLGNSVMFDVGNGIAYREDMLEVVVDKKG